MSMNIYAGATKASMGLLPSPVEITPSRELIWSADTGRAQEGENKAKMIGSVVGAKITYNIKWGVLPSGDGSTTIECFQRITTLLQGTAPSEFFYFGVGQTLASAQAGAIVCYRGNIDYAMLPIGANTYYKDISVQLIEQ